MKSINEIATSRLLKHLTDDNTLAMISTYRTERSEKENLNLLKELKNTVRSMKLGFSEFVARWVETDADNPQNSIASDERSLMIYNISMNDAIKLGKKYDQSSIIFKSKDKCAEVCTVPFTDWEGNEHKEGQIVRIFNVQSPKPLNINTAKAIFEKRLGGPASKPVKGNRPFTLTSVHEVESPRGSTFSESEKLYKIF